MRRDKGTGGGPLRENDTGRAFVVLQTDFGLNWGAVASMYGVCKQVDPRLEIFDLSHTIEQFNTLAASGCLQYTIKYWPVGTVFVSVVDPGVGTPRRACVARTSNGYYIVTPDNGTLTHVKAMYGIDEVREIDESVNRYPGSEGVNVFHGRDLFAYCAARLASGIITFEEVGPAYPMEEIIVHELVYGTVSEGVAEGQIDEALEKFGNISTNILIEDFRKTGIREGETVRVRIYHDGTAVYDDSVLYHRSFGFVEIGKPVLFNGLASFMAVGLNQRSFAEKYGIKGGAGWTIRITKEGYAEKESRMEERQIEREEDA